MKLYVIKIGGSVCTEKASGKAKVRSKIVRQIARQLKQAGIGKKFHAVLIHGAGPFGHTLVKKYKLNNGVKTKKQREGALKVQRSVLRENIEIVTLLKKEGVNAVGIQPHQICVQKNKQLISMDLDSVKAALQGGLVPVLYGDMVPDTVLGISVVSGDALAPYLARKLKANAVFYGTDVAGIYQGDPKTNKNAKLIRKITKANYRAVLAKVEGSKAVDVTGGMRGKLKKLRKTMKGIPITIFNMLRRRNTLKVMLGKPTQRTMVNF